MSKKQNKDKKIKLYVWSGKRGKESLVRLNNLPILLEVYLNNLPDFLDRESDVIKFKTLYVDDDIFEAILKETGKKEQNLIDVYDHIDDNPYFTIRKQSVRESNMKALRDGSRFK